VLHVRHTVVHRKAYAVEERAHVAIAVDEWSRSIRCGQIGVSGRPATEHPVMGRAIQRRVRGDRVSTPGTSRTQRRSTGSRSVFSDSPQYSAKREELEGPRLSGARESGRDQVCHEPMRTGQRQDSSRTPNARFRPKGDSGDRLLCGVRLCPGCDTLPPTLRQ
jgi:hypothetical protein